MEHEVDLVWSKPHKFKDKTEYTRYASIFKLKGIYMILADGKAWYIGKTYDQNFRRRVVQQHYKDRVWRHIRRRSSGSISFKIGEVQPYSQEKVTRSLIKDVEDLLISCVYPECNSKCNNSYNGRRPLKIYNIGHKYPLPNEYCSDEIPMDES